MRKINDLNEEQQKLLDELFWLDECGLRLQMSPGTIEYAESIAKLKKDLLSIRGDATRTLEFLSGLLLESRAILSGREEEKKRSEKRRKTAENAVNRLTTVIENIIGRFDINKIDLDECGLRLQMSPGTIEYAPNFDPSTLPKDCVKIEYKPLEKEIKAYIENGASFEGVFLVKRETLRVQ